jgi:hypothetical protein
MSFTVARMTRPTARRFRTRGTLATPGYADS